MAQTPLHDWLEPRLQALLRDAVAAGFEREAVVAVITDIMTARPFDTVAPPGRSQFPLGEGI